MKSKFTLTFVFLFITSISLSQISDTVAPFIETTAKIDTLVTPDKIQLLITLKESDSKGRTSIEEYEVQMKNVLQAIGIDLTKQLSIFNFKSNFRTYFLRKKEVLKTKSYSLIVFDSQTAGEVVIGLERADISNVYLHKTEYSQMEELKMKMRSKVIRKAKSQARISANAIDQKIGKAIYISDLDANVAKTLSGKAAGVIVRGYASGISKSLYGNTRSLIDIDFDKIKIESAITAKFELQ